MDEIFFSISTSANRALYTLNKTSACAHLNYLANIYFPEIVFIKINDMFKPYFKKENFTQNLICFNEKYTIYNAFIIVLLNNTETVLTYLKKLK